MDTETHTFEPADAPEDGLIDVIWGELSASAGLAGTPKGDTSVTSRPATTAQRSNHGCMRTSRDHNHLGVAGRPYPAPRTEDMPRTSQCWRFSRLGYARNC